MNRGRILAMCARMFRGWWVLVLVLPGVEIGADTAIRAAVPTTRAWADATQHVRADWKNGDLVVAAPYWVDPVLRRHLGDRISWAQAGHHDLARHQRLWVVSTRGQRSPAEPETEPDFVRSFGPLEVRRHDLGESPVIFDFTRRIRDARVTLDTGEGELLCAMRTSGPEGRSGLDQGPMQPAQRFVCDPRRPWLWVGETMLEDLALRPRHCVWTHPQGSRPVRITFQNVPLGSRVVLRGGLYWVHERWRKGGPTRVSVQVDGTEIGTMVHRDGDGFKRLVAMTGAKDAGRGSPRHGEVSFEVRAEQPHHRSFCWSATMETSVRKGLR